MLKIFINFKYLLTCSLGTILIGTMGRMLKYTQLNVFIKYKLMPTFRNCNYYIVQFVLTCALLISIRAVL